MAIHAQFQAGLQTLTDIYLPDGARQSDWLKKQDKVKKKIGRNKGNMNKDWLKKQGKVIKKWAKQRQSYQRFGQTKAK